MKHRTEERTEEPMATARKISDDRYRAEIRYRGRALGVFPMFEVDLVTTHTIQSVPEVETVFSESRLLVPVVVLGARWARSKARRMVAAAYRRDVREAQPWVVTG